MSRRDYIEAARIISWHREHLASICSSSDDAERMLDSIAEDLATMFKRNNDRFNRARFYQACGMEA